MDDDFQEGEIYSAEDAIFDEDAYKSLFQSKVSIPPRIHSKIALIDQFNRRPANLTTCFVHFLSKQLIREMVKFLNFQDFFAFTGTCRRYNYFLSDPYVEVRFPTVCQSGYLFPSPISRKDIHESMVKQELSKGKRTQTYSFLHSKHVNLVHVEESGSEVFMYSLCEDVISVWKLSPTTQNTEEIALLQSLPEISAISGYKDQIISGNSQQIVLSSRNAKPGMTLLEGLESFSIETHWTFGPMSQFHWLMSGELTLAVCGSTLYLLRPSLEVIGRLSFPAAISIVHIESMQSPIALIYDSTTLSVFNFKRSLTECVYRFEIANVVHVRSHSVKAANHRKDFVFALTSHGHLFASASQRLQSEQIAEISLVSDYLVALELRRETVFVYTLSLRGAKLKQTIRFSPALSHFVPLQEKLIAIKPDLDGVSLTLSIYNSRPEYYSLPISISRVSSVRYHPPFVLIKGTTFEDEDCLVVTNLSVLVPASKLNDFNMVLRKKIVDEEEKQGEMDEMEEEKPAKRAHIEKKRLKKNKGRIDFRLS